MNINRGSFNFKCSYEIYGNASIHEAEVVVVTDVPTHDLNRDANALLINQIWNNHLIIVEQTPYRKVIHASENPLTQRLSVKATIKGCDMPTLAEQVNALNEKENRLALLESTVKEDLVNGRFRLFLDPEHAFMPLMACACKKKEGRKVLKTLTNGNGNQSLFVEQVNALIKTINYEFKQKVSNLYRTSFSARLQLAKQAIAEGLISSQKVMVYLNANFVIRNPQLRGKDYDIEPLQTYLETKKFVIINIRNCPLRLPEDMPALWEAKQEQTRPAWMEEWEKEFSQEEEDLVELSTKNEEDGLEWSSQYETNSNPLYQNGKLKRSCSYDSLSDILLTEDTLDSESHLVFQTPGQVMEKNNNV